MEYYAPCLFYLEFSIPLMHEPLTNQNTAFLCERSYGKLSRLRAGRIIHRDYKRIEAASGDEPRNKLNKSNGGQI